MEYVLMIQDDHYDYNWVFVFADTAVENATTTITDWCAEFGVTKSLMYDGAKKIKNETLRRPER